MRLPLIVLLLSALTAPALAANGADVVPSSGDTTLAAPAPAPAPAPARRVAAGSDQDARVCRMVREIGSNRATRVCRTKAQIEVESETARGHLNGAAGDRSL